MIPWRRVSLRFRSNQAACGERPWGGIGHCHTLILLLPCSQGAMDPRSHGAWFGYLHIKSSSTSSPFQHKRKLSTSVDSYSFVINFAVFSIDFLPDISATMQHLSMLNAAALLFSSLIAFSRAEDALYSERRLEKRYIDADGNWNMCM